MAKRTYQDQWLLLFDKTGIEVDPDLAAYHTVGLDWSVVSDGLEEDLVWLITAGVCLGSVGGKRLRLEPGTLLWAAPGAALRFRLARPGVPITLYRVRVGVEPGARPPIPAPCVTVKPAWDLLPLMQRVVLDAAERGPDADAYRRALLKALFAGIFRAQRRRADDKPVLSTSQRQRLMDLTAREPAGRWSAADLAGHLDLSADYFTRLFRATFGAPPRRWLVEQRIRNAAHRLLESPTSVSDLAAELGYPDVFLFSRQFKQVTGLSPSRYRETHLRGGY